jgi:hypothetical protein
MFPRRVGSGLAWDKHSGFLLKNEYLLQKLVFQHRAERYTFIMEQLKLMEWLNNYNKQSHTHTHTLTHRQTHAHAQTHTHSLAHPHSVLSQFKQVYYRRFAVQRLNMIIIYNLGNFQWNSASLLNTNIGLFGTALKRSPEKLFHGKNHVN